MTLPADSLSRVTDRRPLGAAALALCACLLGGCVKTPERAAVSTPDGKIAPPASFVLEGKPFCFGGSSNYYAIYKPRPVVDDLLLAAKALDLRVMRVWGMMDRGSLDGKVPSSDPDGGDKEGVYFQYWDPVKQAPAYNDGPQGLERLDYVLAKAAELDLKLIVVLVNNWRAFGGIDQYVMWYGRDKHDEFFTAPELKAAYKAWVSHVIGRTNRINGRKYKDDPTVFAWELANEPRMKGDSAFDRSTGWDKSTLTDWAGEMSAYVKSLDANHMVSVGDEGFLDGGGEHWAYKTNDGVDNRALTALPAIDFGTFHLYPDNWGTTVEWGEQWIVDHLHVARDVGKPTVLEEYGVKVSRANGKLGPIVQGAAERERAYRRWNELMLQRGGNGCLPWMLSGIDEGEGRPMYPDYDGYGFYRDDETGRLIGDYAKKFITAPACEGQPPGSGGPPSPFVRAKKAPGSIAFGWVGGEG